MNNHLNSIQRQDDTNIKGSFEIISLDSDGNIVWQSPVMSNLILNAGLSQIIQHHAGTAVVPLAITSIEIGTGNAPVTPADTALDELVLSGVPIARTTPSTANIILDFFIVDAELPEDTYREVMLRAGSTPFTRALFTTPYTKAPGRDTIIRYTLSYAAV